MHGKKVKFVGFMQWDTTVKAIEITVRQKSHINIYATVLELHFKMLHLNSIDRAI